MEPKTGDPDREMADPYNMKAGSDDPDRDLADFYGVLLSALAVADKLGLSMVGIRLDGAVVEMEKVIAARASSPAGVTRSSR